MGLSRFYGLHETANAGMVETLKWKTHIPVVRPASKPAFRDVSGILAPKKSARLAG